MNMGQGCVILACRALDDKASALEFPPQAAGGHAAVRIGYCRSDIEPQGGIAVNLRAIDFGGIEAFHLPALQASPVRRSTTPPPILSLKGDSFPPGNFLRHGFLMPWARSETRRTLAMMG